MSLKRVAIVGSFAASFLDFRGNLAKCLISHGYDVHVLLPGCDTTLASAIEDLGVTLHSYPVQRAGKNPLADFVTLRALRKLLLEIQPTHVLSYTIKPVIYSNLALQSTSLTSKSFALITGLGYLFTANTVKSRMARALILPVYRRAMSRCKQAIFQNSDDRQLFVEHQMATEQGSMVVGGSGVDVEHYQVKPLPSKPVFLMVARLIRDKGINEYFEAAKLVHKRWPEAECHLVGYIDENPSSLTREELEAGLASSGIVYHGETEDVRPFLEKASVFVLPSYREGTPRTVLEAMSMGRAIITTDVPGCRETVTHGVNGYLVTAKSGPSLAVAMERYLENPDIVAEFGAASRAIACSRFQDTIVNKSIVHSLDKA